MKKIFTLLLLITLSTAFGQTKENLKTRTEKMYKMSLEMKFDDIMDLTYPKVFDIVDRKTMSTAMKNAFDNEVMTISITDMKPVFNYSDIKEYKEKKYSVIRYRNGLKMALKGEANEEMAKMMIDGLKASPQFDKVLYDKSSNSILIEGNAIMIAIADEKNDWTFVNYDNEELFNMVFDSELKKVLGL